MAHAGATSGSPVEEASVCWNHTPQANEEEGNHTQHVLPREENLIFAGQGPLFFTIICSINWGPVWSVQSA